MDQEITKILQEKIKTKDSIQLLSTELENLKREGKEKTFKKVKTIDRLDELEKEAKQIPQIVKKVDEMIKKNTDQATEN